MMRHPLQPFLDCYPPGADVIPVRPQLLDAYRGVVPDSLIALWEGPGVGFYGQRELQIIRPFEYTELLSGWLTRDLSDLSRVPVVLSAFGKIMYLRILGEDADSFKRVMCDEQEAAELLDTVLATQARQILGPLHPGEMYFYVPALVLGGSQDAASVRKGNALVHLNVQLQMAQE